MKSKKALLALACVLASTVSMATKKSVNPKYMNQDLHYLYKHIDLDSSFDFVDLKGPKSLGFMGYDDTGKNTRLSIEEYLKQVSWSQSVFPSTAGSGQGNGTSFYVGGNLVLTNRHVAETNNTDKDCGSYDILVQIPFMERVYCKEVLYCSEKFDFCLIEMKNFRNGDSLSKHLPAFKLVDTTGVKKIDNVYAIGNAVNYGIQGSNGSKVYRKTVSAGITPNADTFVHHTPTFGGSSGSPMLNNEGHVVGINFAGDIFYPTSFRIQESEGVSNYAVPADVIIKELNENLSGAIIDQLGRSEVNFLSSNQILEKLFELRKKIYSTEEVDKLQKHLAREKTFYYLKNNGAWTYWKKDINASSLLTEIQFDDERVKKIIEIISSDLNRLPYQFVQDFRDKIFYHHKQILVDKAKYLDVQENCEKLAKNKNWIDGCLFENLFRPLFDQTYENYDFTNEQTELLWDQLVKMGYLSTDKYFNYAESSIDSNRASFSYEFIGPVNYLAFCAINQKQKFSHLYNFSCKDSVNLLLEENGFTMINEELVKKVDLKFIGEKEYQDVLKSFRNDVTSKNFICLFNNKKCERKKYREILKKWKYGKDISNKYLDKLVNALADLHQR